MNKACFRPQTRKSINTFCQVLSHDSPACLIKECTRSIRHSCDSSSGCDQIIERAHEANPA